MKISGRFLTNYSETTFLEHIKQCLRTCDEFAFSVSFIKRAGLVLLYKDIEAAVERGVKGRLITSTYQNFTDIESLKSFFKLASSNQNFECHLDFESFNDRKNYSTLGFHSKGYIFHFSNHSELVVGSSNITRFALLKNIEWDLVLNGNRDTQAIVDATCQFEELWKGTEDLTLELINKYSTHQNYAIERWDMDYDVMSASVKPNYMQRNALKELNRYRAMGENRSLIIAAAGSGKTYLAAFDALNFGPERLLYIVHEGSIMRKSLETFQTIFGADKTYGIYDGTSKELDADFVFSTNITMCKSLELYGVHDFDYIIVDECHHATADTYKKIIEYFKPEFLLGLTATPERMDNQDVFELFDKNIPFELRLREAIINDLIVPFKYYGIRDKMVDYGLTKDQERRLIAQLASEEHCGFIHEKIEEHREHGKLKALAFCRNISHARMMAEQMSEFYHTVYLSGKNTIGERIRAYNDLQNDAKDLEILFTVDILNEGVDIPGVNMVLFLRPTESSTIFIQQLGRGLRKCINKRYVTVLDFIGNSYKRSVQIAFALGSLAKNFVLEKRLIASLVRNVFRALALGDYGVEFHIDDLSKEDMINYIENENFNKKIYLKQDYFNFKKYINSPDYPRHVDYLNNDCAPDLLRFMAVKEDGKKNCSYYNFLRGIEEENLPTFSDRQIAFINYLSDNYLPLVRPHEYLIVRYLLEGHTSRAGLYEYVQSLVAGYKQSQVDHAITFLDDFLLADKETVMLDVETDDQFEEYVNDLLDYGLTRYSAEYGDNTGFNLWAGYSMGQVLLKMERNPKANQKGTTFVDNEVFIFASIKKDASMEEHLKYNDKFLEPALFQWECEAGLNEAQQAKLKGTSRAYLFIRKVCSENGIVLPFTYVGTGKLTNPRKTNNVKGSLLFDIRMNNELPDYLQYDFGMTQM